MEKNNPQNWKFDAIVAQELEWPADRIAKPTLWRECDVDRQALARRWTSIATEAPQRTSVGLMLNQAELRNF